MNKVVSSKKPAISSYNLSCLNMQIGNPTINDETDLKGMIDYFGSHAIISDETVFAIRKYCNFSPNADTQSNECIEAAEDIGYNTQVIDIYNIYAPLCFDGNLTKNPKKTSVHILVINLSKKLGICTTNNVLSLCNLLCFVLQWRNFDPCSDFYTYAYMNRQDVQEALHANVTKLGHDWEACGYVYKSTLAKSEVIKGQ